MNTYETALENFNVKGLTQDKALEFITNSGIDDFSKTPKSLYIYYISMGKDENSAKQLSGFNPSDNKVNNNQYYIYGGIALAGIIGFAIYNKSSKKKRK